MSVKPDGLLRIAGISAIVAPWLQLASGLMQQRQDLEFEWTLVYWLAFVLYVPAIFGIVRLARLSGSRLAPWAGAVAFVGAMAGASMQVLFRARAVLQETGQADALRALDASQPLAATTMYIGILFPVGVLLLAICLFASRAVPRWAAVVLGLGALAFPAGNAVEIFAAQIASDAMMIVGFTLVGLRMIKIARAPTESAS